MVILTQDKDGMVFTENLIGMCIDDKRCFKIEKIRIGAYGNSCNVVLGEYIKRSRANEIFKELYDALIRGDYTYKMPEE